MTETNDLPTPPAAPNPSVVLKRSLAKRCPACGVGTLFRGWFAMNACCSECGYDFQREPGFYLGSIYVNYGLTSILVTAAYIYLFVQNIGEDWQRLLVLMSFAVLFPIWFFPYARSVWLGFDYRWDGWRHPVRPRSNSSSQSET